MYFIGVLSHDKKNFAYTTASSLTVVLGKPTTIPHTSSGCYQTMYVLSGRQQELD